jgi:DNA-binding CsgD family transcriptional regulator
MSENNELSEREVEILRLVATGASNKEIAQQLFISANTVKVHLRNIFSKIGVESRTEAAIYAMNTGLAASPAAIAELGAIAQVEPIEVNALAGEALPALLVEPVSKTAGRRGYLITIMILLITLAAMGAWILYQRGGILGPVSLPIPDPTEGRWVEAAPLPVARKNLAVAVFEDRLYAIGGETVDGSSNRMERFLPESGAWERLADKPTAVSQANVAVIGGKLYLPGGKLAGDQVSKVLEIYDPRLDRWQAGAELPLGLSAYGLAAFEGKLYLFGGWDGEKYIDQVYRYDPELDRWELSPYRMSRPRGQAGAVVVGSKIYLVGGNDGSRPTNLVEAYSPELESRGEDPWIRRRSLPQAREAMGIAAIADNIYILGGLSSAEGVLPNLAYDPLADAWSAVETPVTQPWFGLGLAPLGNRLYAVGGELGGNLTGRTTAYQAIYTVLLPVVR